MILDVGKSCLLMQYVEQKFRSQQDATVGVEYGSKELIHKDKKFKLQIWDTVMAGQESFRSITRAYYRGSIVCILVFDITNQKSFESISDWYNDVKTDTSESTQLLLVGNKSDMTADRQVSISQAQLLAKQIGCTYEETSAKTGENVENIFKTMVTQVYDKIKLEIIDLNDSNTGIKIGSLTSNEKAKQLKVIDKPNNCC